MATTIPSKENDESELNNGADSGNNGQEKLIGNHPCRTCGAVYRNFLVEGIMKVQIPSACFLFDGGQGYKTN